MTRITLQILQNYSHERNPCIIVTQGKNKYLFNMGEPFLRYYMQHNVKLVSNMNIFFTRNTFDCMNGIQNLITSLYGGEASVGTKIYGPQDLVAIFNKFRCPYTRFISYSFYDLITNEKVIGMNDILVARKLKKDKPEEFNQHYYVQQWNEFVLKHIHSKQINDPSVLVDIQNKQLKGQEQLTIDYISLNNNKCLAYQINLPPIKGKLDKEKLDSYKIPKNQMKSLMQNGFVVIEGTGQTVKLDDLKIEDAKGNSCLLFDCDSEQTLSEAILEKRILYKPSETNQLVLVVHMVSSELLQTPQYKDFLKMFNPEVQHIFIAPGVNEIISDQQDQIINIELKHKKVVSQLNKDFPEYLLDISTKQTQFIKQSEQNDQSNNMLINQILPEFKNIQLSKKNYEFILSGNSNEYIPYHAIVANELNKVVNFNETYLQKLEEFKNIKIIENSNKQIQNNNDEKFDPEIILLGTTCALPSKYRNNSSILIKNQKNNTSLMLDAGDGTYFQLLSIFGQEKVDEELLKLKIILISHFHADHHMGFQEVIWRRQEVQRKRHINFEDDPIYLVLPWDMATWADALRKMSGNLLFKDVYIQSYNKENFEEYNERGYKNIEYDGQKYYYNTYEQDKAQIRNKNILNILKTNEEQLQKNQEGYEQKINNIGYSSIKMIPVVHCQQAYAFILEANDKDKTKISYTGDTRPCKRFTDAAQNSSLVIHESTYEHDEVDLAEKALHSTVTEAIDVALQSNSQNLLLTHISKRHKILKIHLEGQSQEFIDFADKNTAMAYDFLRFKLSEFQQIVPITKFLGYIYKKNPI